jgi:hypothetical protein
VNAKSRFVLLQQQRSGKQRQAAITGSAIKVVSTSTTAGSSGGAVQSRTVKNADASIEIGQYIKERAAKARYTTYDWTVSSLTLAVCNSVCSVNDHYHCCQSCALCSIQHAA